MHVRIERLSFDAGELATDINQQPHCSVQVRMEQVAVRLLLNTNVQLLKQTK